MSLPEQPQQQSSDKKQPGFIESVTNFFNPKTDNQNPEQVQQQQPNSSTQGGRKTKRVIHKKRVIKRKKNKTKKSRRTKN